MALVSEAAETTDIPVDADIDDKVEDNVTALSLPDICQQLKGFATFTADNLLCSAKMVLQKFSDKVAKTLVTHIILRHQQRTAFYLSAA